MKILSVVGTRPNMMKIAPIIWELQRVRSSIEHLLVHTGQHYDASMNDVFLSQLRIGKPDYHLGVRSGSPSAQVGQIISGLGEILNQEKPDLVLVVGDVNSTLAAAVAASKAKIPIAHVEAGLRSFDRTMPEELNRLATDSLSDLLFVTEPSGIKNLRQEGVDHFINDGGPVERISTDIREAICSLRNGPELRRCGIFVGNLMIDTLLAMREHAETAAMRLPAGEYALLTLHRPGNVDNPEVLGQIVRALAEISRKVPIIFPCHPRTLSRIKDYRLESYFEFISGDEWGKAGRSIAVSEPLGYFEFLKLMSNSSFVLTDSGGIQEETTILGVPCFTLRDNTERPITIEMGTNILAGTDYERILETVLPRISVQNRGKVAPPLWDGRAAERLVEVLELVGSS